MRKVIYETPEGHKYKVLLPDDAPDSHAEFGVVIGPPDLSELGLPLELEVRLNNALFNRGLLTLQDVRRRRLELIAAWQSVLAVDANKIMELY